MKICSFNYSNFKMFNPITGEVIVEEECRNDAKSLKGYWLCDLLDEPVINEDKLRTAWEDFMENYIKDNQGIPFSWDAVEKFLENLDNPLWIAYEVTSTGIACGPVSFTDVFIVDKDVIVEELS
jgi:hypothetical protein